MRTTGSNMQSLRLAPADAGFQSPCGRCGDASRGWDRIAGKVYCPSCLECLAQGEATPIVERTDRRRCAVCSHQGTLRYLTYPLHSRRPIEIDLCSEHLRGLVARRLGPHAFEQLRRQLGVLGIGTGEVFLLHEAFYDEHGRAQQPVLEGYF